jgi:hypothetical protein
MVATIDGKKRGRKTRQELIDSIAKSTSTSSSTSSSNIHVLSATNDVILNSNIDFNITEKSETTELKKKRGRKPKGGKLVSNIQASDDVINDRPNVILHLRCYMKDLETNENTFYKKNNIESYNYSSLAWQPLSLTQNERGHLLTNTDLLGTSSGSLLNNSISQYDEEVEEEDILEYNSSNSNSNSNSNSSVKTIWKKLKTLEHILHVNNTNKRCACFWDTCEFDSPPIYIPKYFINETYEVYGCFCSPECACAYLMEEKIDHSTKFERYHLLNHLYSKIYEYDKNIKPAANPYYMLDKFYGNLTIQEYRSLLKTDRLFLIIDKPISKILPELHEDNDEFILNKKLIPASNTISNGNSIIKKKCVKTKQKNKTSIVNETFGITE